MHGTPGRGRGLSRWADCGYDPAVSLAHRGGRADRSQARHVGSIRATRPRRADRYDAGMVAVDYRHANQAGSWPSMDLAAWHRQPSFADGPRQRSPGPLVLAPSIRTSDQFHPGIAWKDGSPATVISSSSRVNSRSNPWHHVPHQGLPLVFRSQPSRRHGVLLLTRTADRLLLRPEVLQRFFDDGRTV